MTAMTMVMMIGRMRMMTIMTNHDCLWLVWFSIAANDGQAPCGDGPGEHAEGHGSLSLSAPKS